MADFPVPKQLLSSIRFLRNQLSFSKYFRPSLEQKNLSNWCRGRRKEKKRDEKLARRRIERRNGSGLGMLNVEREPDDFRASLFGNGIGLDSRSKLRLSRVIDEWKVGWLFGIDR